jgi:hypothetical protein
VAVKNEEKEKQKVFSLFSGELPQEEFSLGDLVLKVQVPTVWDEGKILYMRLNVFKNLYLSDESLKEFINSSKIPEPQVEDGKIKTKQVEFDPNNINHLEFAFDTLTPSSFRELINRLAYLEVVVKEIKNTDGEVIKEKMYNLLPQLKTSNIHLRDIIDLTDNIMVWVEKFNSVDPFLSKN